MALHESDTIFLKNHDFNRDAPFLLGDNEMQEQTTILYQRAETFLRDQYDRSFTTKDMMESVGISRSAALKYLRGREDVEPTLKRKDGYIERWLSHVAPIEPTREGLEQVRREESLRNDELGREARLDFYMTQKRGSFKKRVKTRYYV